jgi:hypothetical protein
MNILLRDNPTAFETRDAVPRPASFDADNNTVEAVIASATPVPRQDTRGAFHEILDPAGLDIAASRGASVLDGHRQDGVRSILGTLDDIRVEGNEVIGLIRFSARPEFAPIVADIRSGIIRHLSVGYEVSTWRDGSAGGATRTKTATKWTIREASFVSVPADPNARTRGFLDGLKGRAATNRAIRELCSRSGVDPTVTDDLIDREASIEDARGAVLDALIARGGVRIMTAHNTETLDNPAVFVRAAAEALYYRVAPSHQPSGPARQYLGLTIPELARETLRRVGENVTGLGGPELVTRALHTTSDFPLILADTVGRTLRASYTAAPSGVRSLARQTTAADFRTKHRLMLDSTGVTLEKVNEHGEFKSGTMAEGEETYKIDTFGRIFGITRQALVNDDVGAFTDLSRRLGNAAAAFEAQFLVDLLTSQSGTGPDMADGDPLFDTNHGNINTTTGAAPSEDTLKAARLAMRKQTGLGGGLIDVTPWAVLVPSDLETATEKVLSTIQAAKTDDVNPFTSLRLVVEPRLTSTTRWYVVANPASADGLEFAYLAGAAGPQVESQAGFKIDGVEIKVRLDFGAGFVDFRSWYSNAGA